MPEVTLRDRVFNNLKASEENGYFEPGELLHGSSAEDIASDMIAFASDCEEENPDDLVPHIQAYLDQRA